MSVFIYFFLILLLLLLVFFYDGNKMRSNAFSLFSCYILRMRKFQLLTYSFCFKNIPIKQKETISNCRRASTHTQTHIYKTLFSIILAFWFCISKYKISRNFFNHLFFELKKPIFFFFSVNVCVFQIKKYLNIVSINFVSVPDSI